MSSDKCQSSNQRKRKIQSGAMGSPLLPPCRSGDSGSYNKQSTGEKVLKN